MTSIAPKGEKKSFTLGQKVRVKAWLERFFDDGTRTRGWTRVPTEPVEGIVVGIRRVSSGTHVPAVGPSWDNPYGEPAYLLPSHHHRAVLVSTDLRSKIRHALTDDVEVIGPAAVCSVDGCGSPRFARGMCTKHYSRLRKGRPLEDKDRRCTVENCGNRSRARGMCWMHYQRWRRARA